MSRRFVYFDTTYAIEIHDWIIEQSGGKAGMQDLSLLESPLEHVRNDGYYPTLEDKLTHLVFAINKHHAFVDGNKRSSIALGAYFLALNGYDYCVQYFVQQMENHAVEIAKNNIDKALTKEIVTSIIYEDDYSESLKLRIAQAMTANGSQ